MKKTLLIFIISIFFMNNTFSQISTEFQLKEASKAAVIWLNNMNSENYPQAYTELSTEITSKFDSLDWVNGVNILMVDIGEFLGRREIFRQFATNPLVFNELLLNFPDGYYAIFQYESNYKNTLQHSEQLILHQNDKRKWRVLDWSWDFKSKE
jgi:hypothetical protein